MDIKDFEKINNLITRQIHEKKHLMILTLGPTGCGKSSLGCLLLQYQIKIKTENEKEKNTIDFSDVDKKKSDKISFNQNNELLFLDSHSFFDTERTDVKILNSFKKQSKTMNTGLFGPGIYFCRNNMSSNCKIKQEIRFWHNFLKQSNIWERYSFIFHNFPNETDKYYLHTKFKRSLVNFIQYLPFFSINLKNIVKEDEYFEQNRLQKERDKPEANKKKLNNFAKSNQSISAEFFQHIRHDDYENEKERLKDLFVKNDLVIQKKKSKKREVGKIKNNSNDLKFKNEFKNENGNVFKRIVFTDPDGNLTYGKWRLVEG